MTHFIILFTIMYAYLFLGLLIPIGMNRTRDDTTSSEDKMAESGNGPAVEKVHHLYGHGVCKWPGCEIICDDLQSFIK